MAKEIAIQASQMVFAYGNDHCLINDLSLSLFKGETVALVGPNGAGKTTLGKLLTGILKPHSGSLTLFGENGDLPLSQIGQKVGYSFQNPEQQLIAASVEEEIGFGLKYRGANADHISRITNALLHLFELEHLRHSFPLNLSWGEKRRLVLAASLALEPEYLILDEPTTGLDEERIKMLNMVLGRLQARKIGMLLISHNRSFVEHNAQRILHMDKGKITDDRYC